MQPPARCPRWRDISSYPQGDDPRLLDKCCGVSQFGFAQVGSNATSEQRSIVRIARFAKGDGVAYGVGEGETGQAPTIAELHGHPFGVDPAGVRFTGNRYPLAEVRLLAPVLPSKGVAVGKNYAEHVTAIG